MEYFEATRKYWLKYEKILLADVRLSTLIPETGELGIVVDLKFNSKNHLTDCKVKWDDRKIIIWVPAKKCKCI